MEKVYKGVVILFWLAVVIIYPMLISIYVNLPLFVGFAGLIFVLGLEEENITYVIFSFLYMLNLEINLSLPLLLMPISAMIFYYFVKRQLDILKLCRVCVYISTVILIDFIYFFLLAAYDFITDQSSVNYDASLILSLIYDIIAAVLI